MMADKERLLRLWIMPYGVVKAGLGLAAGDNAKVSTENRMTVVTFPLTGELEGLTVKAMLDAKVSTVVTQGPGNLSTETHYFDYADRSEIPTNVIFPGHIVRKRDGKVILDLHIRPANSLRPLTAAR